MTRDDGQDSEAGATERESDEASAAAAETCVLTDEDAAATSAEDDDRTQLVGRGFSPAEQGPSVEESGDRAAFSVKPTRVLDPSVAGGSSDEAPGASGASALADTRVLDDPDKTAPPPVGASESTPAAEAPPAARPAAPTPIDSERGLLPGTVLFGEYEIVNVLGVGGMGEVYRAKHRRLEEHRAIKVMHAELSRKKGAGEFFYREAKALLAVRHPAVVHCHDLLSDDEGRVYLIMEMIEGIPLSKKMNDGPLSPDDVAILGARVAHGLSAAHRKGVIHRDVSPDNIVLPNGRVQEAKIIDFGIAKLLDDGEGTIVDGFKGKLSYASPEQLGFFGGKIDGRSDFYSLGLVLVAAAQGRPMGMGTTVVEAVDARRSLETLPDEIPVGLRSAIQPLLALDPDDRPKYVDRLFVVPGGLDGATDTGSISTGGVVRSGGAKQKSQSRTGLIAGAGVAAAILVGGGLYLGLRDGGATTDPGVAIESRETRDEGGKAVVEGASPAEPSRGAVEEKKPATIAKQPEAPKPRRVSAGDRIKIIGLINNARLALEENRLMSPANDNAYDRYRRVLELDPSDKRAKVGLREVAARYVGMADRAVTKGNLDQARTFVDRAKRADSAYSGIATLEARLSN